MYMKTVIQTADDVECNHEVMSDICAGVSALVTPVKIIIYQ